MVNFEEPYAVIVRDRQIAEKVWHALDRESTTVMSPARLCGHSWWAIDAHVTPSAMVGMSRLLVDLRAVAMTLIGDSGHSVLVGLHEPDEQLVELSMGIPEEDRFGLLPLEGSPELAAWVKAYAP